MADLPKQQTLEQLQSKWPAILNPIIKNPANNSSTLQNVSLTSGVNVINHKLGAKLQGWSIVRQRAAASIYDNQDSNQSPQLTLVLVSSAPVVVDLQVF
jgi:hypothetical protein